MANKVFRQALTAGVVLASAGAIALTPVTVTPELRPVVDTPRVVSIDVMPAGFFQDLQLIGDGARAAAAQSADALTRKIPELWWTVHEQWPDADLLHWNYALVTDILLAPITPLLIGPLNDAVAEAVARNFPILGNEIRKIPDFVEYAFVRLIGPVLSAIGGAGVAHSEIFYSMTTLRIEPFIKAIVRAPLHVIDGLLFGGYGDLGPILPGREGQYLPAPGLFTPWGQPPRVRDIKTPDDIVTTTTVPDADVVSLSTGRAESPTETDTAAIEPATDTVAETPAAAVVETPEPTEGPTPAAPEDTATEAEALPAKPAKPAKKNPATAIRQGIKDVRDSVGHTVKRLTGGSTSSRPGSPDSGDSTGSTKSESGGADGSE